MLAAIRPPALLASAFAAACTSPPQPPPENAAPSALAVRYVTSVLTERPDWAEIPEIWLPHERLVCNIASGHTFTAGGGFEPPPQARAFFVSGPRNTDRNGVETATRRYELPAELAAQLLELARLTQQQQALAERVGSQLAHIVPLDDFFEFCALHDELQRARSAGVDEDTAQRLERRAEELRIDGAFAEDQALRWRELREFVARAVAEAANPRGCSWPRRS